MRRLRRRAGLATDAAATNRVEGSGRRHPRNRAPVLALAAAVLCALLLAACGGKVIDDQKAEEFITQDLASVDVEVERVECPEGVEVEAGAEFECEVVDGRGDRATVLMRIIDQEGLVRPINIEAAESVGGGVPGPSAGGTPGSGADPSAEDSG